MMSFRHFKALVMALLVALLATATLFAQTSTTGAIEGTISDSSGAPIPGVTVEIRSPQLQGTKTETTDAKGNFRFSLIPPGSYSMTASLSGFSPSKQGNIQVGISRTVTLDVKMSQAVSEQITVTAAAPVVDVTSNTTGANVTAQTMQSLPMQRTYTAAIQVAPGTNNDGVGATVYGSSGAENEYIIDGLNTTGVRSGTQGKALNNDFVQEVEVKTGGMPAEYGRITGGVINAITKSGGNQFTGDVFGFDQPSGLRAKNTTFNQQSVTLNSVTENDKKILDGGIDLGGYIVKDRLWFFGAYDYQKRTNLTSIVNAPIDVLGFHLPVGASEGADVKNSLYAGKLTLRASDNQTVTVSLFGDPTKTNGVIFPISGPPSTFLGTTDTGGNDYNARYSGVFGQSLLVNAEAGRHNEKTTIGGEGTQIPRLIDQTVSPNTNGGGFGFFANEKYSRTVEKADISRFISSHEIKLGGDYEDLKGTLQNYQGGAGQRIYKLIRGGVTYYRHRYYVDELAPGYNRDDPTTWKIALPEVTDVHTKNTSAYLQDSWKVRPNLTLNVGVRWEDQKVFGRFDVKAFEISNNWAPRLGIIWDVANNGRSKAYANFGRFYESIPMDINIRSFGGEAVCFCYNMTPDPAKLLGELPTLPNGSPNPNYVRRSSILGGPEVTDPNLKGQHIDEYLVGYDYEVSPNLALGVKGTYRKLANVIEDMLVPATGEYFVANPGSGIGREAGFYDGGSVVTPAAKRTYKGVEIHATKHFSNRTQFFASYLWSRMEGNYDGTFQSSTGQLDPNINSAFDYADFIVNNNGLLSGDRTHQLKFYGSYAFDSGALDGLTFGLAAHYASGTPLTAMGYSAAYANWEYYFTTRGALGRGPADYEGDFHVSYPIQTGPAKVALIADVFNVLNLQRKTALDNRYGRVEDEQCTGFFDPTKCTGDGGIQTVPGTVNPATTVNVSQAPNPSFLKAGTAFSNPRTFRLGVRVTF